MPNKRVQFQHLDADESIFFQRELEHVKAKVHQVDYPLIKNRMLIPVSTEAPPWAEEISYEQYDMVGMAKIISNYADDAPRVDVNGRKFTAYVRDIGDAYGYNIREIQASRALGKPLDVKRANTAREAHRRLEDQVAWEGDSNYNLGGFLSNANTSEYTVPADGTGSSKLWSTKTADQIIRDCMELLSYPFDTTYGIEVADTLLLSPTRYTKAATTKVGNDVNMTVLKWVLENHPTGKNADWVNALTGYGASGTERFLAYFRSPDKLEQEIPQDFQQMPPQERNYEYIINCHARYAGVQIYKPLSIAWGDGI